MGGKYTDAQLAKLPPEKLKETLKKRAQRARRAAEAEAAKRNAPPRAPLSVVSFADAAAARKPDSKPQTVPAAGAEIPGVVDGQERAREMYEALREKFREAKRWNDEAMHGMLVAYCQCVVRIEENGPDEVPPAVLSTITRIWKDLRMEDLPAAREVKASKFGGW